MGDASAHAELPPSGSAAWVRCTQWPVMNATYPGGDKEAAEEGTAAHELVAACGHNVGDVASNGIPFDEEMRRGASVFWEFVEGLVAELVPRGTTVAHHIETRLPPGRFGPRVWGTPDLFWWSDTFRLDVVDYKHGHGFIDAFECWQLIVYVCLILDWYNVNPAWELKLTVGMHIVQPRAYGAASPTRSWVIPASDLRAYSNLLQTAVERYEAGERRAATGEWCKHCPGRHECSTLANVCSHVVDMAGEAIPFKLSPTQAGSELRQLEAAQRLLEARIDGLRDEVVKAIERREPGTGYDLERGPGRRIWKSPAEKIIQLGDLYGKDLRKPPEPITPTQAVQRGVPASVIDSLSTRTTATPKLVLQSNSEARRIFGKTT